jgi:hypothetical protein
MDKIKVANLAKSFTMTCKEVVKNNPLAQKVTSPAVTLIALTILQVVVSNGDPKKSWAM